MTVEAFTARVAERAVTVRPGQVLASAIAAPFWAVGALAGLLMTAAVWVGAACAVGYADARRIGSRR